MEPRRPKIGPGRQKIGPGWLSMGTKIRAPFFLKTPSPEKKRSALQSGPRVPSWSPKAPQEGPR
eukprot:5512939-Karenia_brevis.AAC.1